MCFAPIINLSIAKMTYIELYPLLLCAFGWSYATTLPYITDYVPKSSGVTAYSFLTLLGVYIFARFIRHIYENNMKLKSFLKNRKILLVIIIVCLISAGIGLGDYNSPFALLLATCVFLLFKEFNIHKYLVNIFTLLAPSMFSIYLLHSHKEAFGYISILENKIFSFNIPLSLTYLITAVIIFCICVLYDIPRRIFAYLLGKVLCRYQLISM